MGKGLLTIRILKITGGETSVRPPSEHQRYNRMLGRASTKHCTHKISNPYRPTAIAPRLEATTRPDTRPTPSTLPNTTWVGYSDGSYTAPKPNSPEKAGWGYSLIHGGDGVADTAATMITEGWGPVETDEDAPYFIGAERLTNNTGELSALIEMLRRVGLAIDACLDCKVFIVRPDSTYASNIASGEVHATANVELAGQARTAWRELRDKLDGKLYLSHVSGHSHHKWNDRVDELAKSGSNGEVGGQTGAWAAWPWPREHSWISPVARWIASVTRTVSTHSTV